MSCYPQLLNVPSHASGLEITVTYIYTYYSAAGYKVQLTKGSLTSADHHQHSVELENTEVLTTEPGWFERGVKEAIYIRALNPSLNRDGERYNLPLVWDNIIKKKLM